ncbi:ANTAR domain-containing protein [Streptacidiphilus sp. P02-A3a]|uniref:ANTAR domain-containing protein n=1 Tax=Streptacidiphilus sp. P02-A3a TaxID=2704468 RepID=UPI0015FE240A|nr:ANTAR domain-containing protein [Streptacidiphilus sp. P02-A3a]QMU70678.1 ANTAR domain-containing protein [Streptacidiphilus sp. P02-A3a]
MISDRMAQVLRLLRPGQGSGDGAALAAAGAAALGVDGLAVSLAISGDLTELWWCSTPSSRRFEDLQLTVGEGPGRDAARTGAMVWAPDLDLVRPGRWPALSAEFPALGVRAVFCFPLGVGAARVGVLTAVRDTAGPLSPQQADDGLVLADALTAHFLGGGEPPGQDLDPAQAQQCLQHAVVYQATGMVSVQLAVTLPQALLRLRAHAYSSGRSITDICHDVVARRLRLNPNGNGNNPFPPPSTRTDSP